MAVSRMTTFGLLRGKADAEPGRRSLAARTLGYTHQRTTTPASQSSRVSSISLLTSLLVRPERTASECGCRRGARLARATDYQQGAKENRRRLGPALPRGVMRPAPARSCVRRMIVRPRIEGDPKLARELSIQQPAR